MPSRVAETCSAGKSAKLFLACGRSADFSRYKAVSEQAQAIFAAFDDDLEASSLDEAFLDVTAYCALHNCTGTQSRSSALSPSTPPPFEPSGCFNAHQSLCLQRGSLLWLPPYRARRQIGISAHFMHALTPRQVFIDLLYSLHL